MSDKSKAAVLKEFTLADLSKIMSMSEGRRTIACILELCMHEQPAMAKNATELAANVARQEVAQQIKDLVWNGGGKNLWRKMEDEIELRTDLDEQTEDDNKSDPLDIEN